MPKPTALRIILSSAMLAGATACAGSLAQGIDTVTDETTLITPVLSIYQTTDIDRSINQHCWEMLESQRDASIRTENARPWLMRNMMPLVGAAMGGAVGALVLKSYFSAAAAKTWMLPVVAVGAAGGYTVGPAGVMGAVAGGGIADKLGKHQPPITIAATMAGALAGKKLWDMVFPPAVAPLSETGPEVDIPVEVFVRTKVCSNQTQSAYRNSKYRVSYRFNGEEYSVDLPYDPGEALLLDATGQAVGPAHARVD
jgi:uncharacterized protein YcfJ